MPIRGCRGSGTMLIRELPYKGRYEPLIEISVEKEGAVRSSYFATSTPWWRSPIRTPRDRRAQKPLTTPMTPWRSGPSWRTAPATPEYTYDALGSTITYPDGTKVSYEYDQRQPGKGHGQKRRNNHDCLRHLQWTEECACPALPGDALTGGIRGGY